MLIVEQSEIPAPKSNKKRLSMRLASALPFGRKDKKEPSSSPDKVPEEAPKLDEPAKVEPLENPAAAEATATPAPAEESKPADATATTPAVAAAA